MDVEDLLLKSDEDTDCLAILRSVQLVSRCLCIASILCVIT